MEVITTEVNKSDRSKDIAISSKDANNLFFGLFRYALGKQTYFVSEAAETIDRNWHLIPRHTQNLIRKELAEAIAKDNQQRADGENYLFLGADIDRSVWLWLHSKIKEKA